MKNLKGIFDACSEKLSPDVRDKSKAIGDMMIFQSGAMNKLDRIKDLNPEDMNLPFEGISLPLESSTGKPLANDMISKASDGFDLPGFSKRDMKVDTGERFKDGITEEVGKQVDPYIPDDFMSMEDPKAKTQESAMNLEKPANKFSDDTMDMDKTAAGKKDDDMNVDKPRNEEAEESESDEENQMNELLDMI